MTIALAASDLDATRRRRLVVVLAVGVALAWLASLFIGYAALDLRAALADALRGERSLPALVPEELRLPRALLGCFVGFSLGLAGAAMQGLLRNPLAEPGVVASRGGGVRGGRRLLLRPFERFCAGAAARRHRGRHPRGATFFRPRRPGRGHDDADPRRRRRQQLRRCADQPRAQPVAQPLRGA
jgi:hypothetical protein